MKRKRQGIGRIYKQRGCNLWTIQYALFGRRVREATGTSNYKEAEDKLKERLGDVASGTFVGARVKRIKLNELAETYFAEQKVNGSKSLKHTQARWKKHVAPFMGMCRAAELTTDNVRAYIRRRKEEGAANATVNRELAAIKRVLNFGRQDTPPKIRLVPYIPMLKEDNARKGFVEDADFSRLASEASELWLRTFLEIAYSYGWRKSEILGLRVRQLNFANRTIRLDPGMTKNDEGREVTMTTKVAEMLRQAVIGKSPDSFVLTRADGKPVKEFRKSWQSLCVRAGLGSFVCTVCERTVTSRKCACGSRRRKYRGLIRHDLRRSAAKALRAAGVPESVVMSTGGWKTAAMFRRYAIVSNADQRAAVEMLEKARELQERARAELSHNSAIIALKSTTQGAVANTANKSKRVN